MGYLHIENLYKNTAVLNFKRVYALEKIHGTSAHVRWSDEKVTFFHGGSPREQFVALFDEAKLNEKFKEFGAKEVVFYGEAYGGKVMGDMQASYGKVLRFVVFDVKINGQWAVVPQAERLALDFGFDFVPYVLCESDKETLDTLRDAGSRQAVKLGFGEGKLSEGIVIRPQVELMTQSGERIIAKHKSVAFSERKSKKDTRLLSDKEKLEVLTQADEIAEEWVTEMRLTHVVSKIQGLPELRHIPEVLGAMEEDVLREAKDEIKESKETLKAIRRLTAKKFKARIEQVLPT